MRILPQAKVGASGLPPHHSHNAEDVVVPEHCNAVSAASIHLMFWPLWSPVFVSAGGRPVATQSPCKVAQRVSIGSPVNAT